MTLQLSLGGSTGVALVSQMEGVAIIRVAGLDLRSLLMGRPILNTKCINFGFNRPMNIPKVVYSLLIGLVWGAPHLVPAARRPYSPAFSHFTYFDHF
jgi:hypothetical protein